LFFAKNFLCASFAASVAEICTIPIDTSKVRLQIQAKSGVAGSVPKYSGFIGTMKTIIREEGYLSLYNGLSAGI